MTLFGVHYRIEGESAEKDSVRCIKRSRRFLLTLSLSEIANNEWPKFISFRFSEILLKWPTLQEMRWLPGAAPPDPPEEAQRALRPPAPLLHAIGVCANASGVRLISAPPPMFCRLRRPWKSLCCNSICTCQCDLLRFRLDFLFESGLNQGVL